MGENKMRAKKEIPIEKQVEKLASCGLTNKEIAEALGYDDSTLKRKFENFLTKGKANLKQRLKRKQIDENGEYEIVINRKTIDERSETEKDKRQKEKD